VRCVVGLDIGNTSCKGGVLREDGVWAVFTRRLFVSDATKHSPIAWWMGIQQILYEIEHQLERSRLYRPEALCLCGRGNGLAVLDSSNAPVDLLWREDSTIHECSEPYPLGHERIGRWSTIYDFLRRRYPAVSKRIARMCSVKDYLNLRLTGQWATDPSTAGCWKWPSDLGRDVIPREFIPPIRSWDETLGIITDPPDLQFLSGIPVLVGCHDGVAANLGAGMFGEWDGCVTLGTNAVLRVNCRVPPKPTKNSSFFAYPFFNKLWVTGGDLAGGGIAVEWIDRLLFQGGDMHLESSSSLGRIDALAAKATAGARGLIFLPYLKGSVSPAWDLSRRAAFANVSVDHGPAEFARAVLEGIAMSLRHIRDHLHRAGIVPCKLALTGGGSQSQLWSSIIASVLNAPLIRADAEASARGAAILAAVSSGIYPTLEKAISAMCKPGDMVSPVRSWVKVYSEAFEQFRRWATSYPLI
jgi:xylulokinase